MTADRWTHHDPAVRDLIRRAQADAWDEATRSAYLHETEHHISIRHDANPYRDEATR